VTSGGKSSSIGVGEKSAISVMKKFAAQAEELLLQDDDAWESPEVLKPGVDVSPVLSM
jgi:hypothetical protein